MGLINLKTDLKSLRYGNDRIGGANSGQPYITTDIPDRIGPYIGTTDFLLRGGTNAITDSLEDIKRLGKMFADTRSPNGLLFIAKQQLLSRTAVRTQTSGILNEGIYSPLNTLAEAGLIAFGGHLNKQGINPFADTGAYANNINLYGVRVKPSQPVEENRLTELLRGSYQGRPINFDGNRVVLNNGINVMTYTGGPGSRLGVGNTGIRYSQTSQTFLTKTGKNDSFSNNTWVYNSTLINSPFSPEPSSLDPLSFDPFGPFNPSSPLSSLISPQPNSLDVSNGSKASPKVQDFRKILRTQIGTLKQDGRTSTESGATPETPDYDVSNIESRVNLGDPGKRGDKNYSNYAKGVVRLGTNASYYGSVNTNLGSYNTGLDKITSIPVYRSENVIQDPSVNDLCKFRIAVIDNDDPSFKTFMHFRAFLGPMSDSYNANWNSFQYLGRGENFYTYSGFTRQISLSWTVAAQSKEELIPMYKKLNYLASTLAPDYSPNGFMRGNLVQLTIGGYLYEQPGFITSLTYDIQEDTPWEIGIGVGNGTEDGSVKELPHIIRVSGFNFVPIQNFIPRFQKNTFSTNGINTQGTGTGMSIADGPERFIALANGIDPSQTNYSSITKPTA